MEFIDTKTIYTIFHIIGAVLGAGGAYVSDAIFMSSVKDGKVDSTELRFMKIGSRFVWVGLGVLILSGIGLFTTDPALYMESSKFLAKMSIVLIIAINGVLFHTSHLPRIERHAGGHLPSSDEFMRKKTFLLSSGAVSFVSWTAALILGSLRAVPYDYTVVMSIYGALILVAVATVLLVSRHTKILRH